MQWLLVALGALVEKILAWFAARGARSAAFIFTYLAFVTSAFLGFLALARLTINSITVVAPDGVGLALAVLPPSTGTFISAYLTVLIAKRVFDWHKHFARDLAMVTNK